MVRSSWIYVYIIQRCGGSCDHIMPSTSSSRQMTSKKVTQLSTFNGDMCVPMTSHISHVFGTIRLKQLHQGSKLDMTIRYANFFQRKYYAFARNTEPPTPSSFKIWLSFCWGTIGLCFVDCSDDLCTFGMFFVSSSWGGGWFAVFGESDFFLETKPRVFVHHKNHPLKKRMGKKRALDYNQKNARMGLNHPKDWV